LNFQGDATDNISLKLQALIFSKVQDGIQEGEKGLLMSLFKGPVCSILFKELKEAAL